MSIKAWADYCKRTVIMILIIMLLLLAFVVGFLCLSKWVIGDWKGATEVNGLLLGQLGNLLLGIAAIYGVNVFANERKNRRSDAAAFILAKIQKCIAEIIQIAAAKGLYQYASHGKLYSEDTNDEKIPHPERPARMIYQKAQQLKIDLFEPNAQVPLQTAVEVNELVDEIQKMSASLGSAIYSTLDDRKFANTLQHVEDTTANYRQTLEVFEQRAKTLLAPIIEYGG